MSYILHNHLASKTETYCYFTGIKIDNNSLYFSINNAYKKCYKRTQHIISCIEKRINNKKNKNISYQIRGIHEYNVVREYCEIKKIKYQLISDDTQKTNKVYKIKQYITDYDHENNLQKLHVEYEKIPRLYIKILFSE